MANSLVNWGDFCTYCGLTLSGKFPRKCGNGHFTYASDVMISVALQPVLSNGRTGILCVRRNIKPFIGEYALPGGYVDHGELPQSAAIRELSEESLIRQQNAVYFSEDIGGSHSDADPRLHVMHFYKLPLLHEEEIDLNFKNEEVQSLAVVFLTKNDKELENKDGDKTTLCFSTHHKAALEFLQSL